MLQKNNGRTGFEQAPAKARAKTARGACAWTRSCLRVTHTVQHIGQKQRGEAKRLGSLDCVLRNSFGQGTWNEPFVRSLGPGIGGRMEGALADMAAESGRLALDSQRHDRTAWEVAGTQEVPWSRKALESAQHLYNAVGMAFAQHARRNIQRQKNAISTGHATPPFVQTQYGTMHVRPLYCNSFF